MYPGRRKIKIIKREKRKEENAARKSKQNPNSIECKINSRPETIMPEDGVKAMPLEEKGAEVVPRRATRPSSRSPTKLLSSSDEEDGQILSSASGSSSPESSPRSPNPFSSAAMNRDKRHGRMFHASSSSSSAASTAGPSAASNKVLSNGEFTNPGNSRFARSNVNEAGYMNETKATYGDPDTPLDENIDINSSPSLRSPSSGSITVSFSPTSAANKDFVGFKIPAKSQQGPRRSSSQDDNVSPQHSPVPPPSQPPMQLSRGKKKNGSVVSEGVTLAPPGRSPRSMRVTFQKNESAIDQENNRGLSNGKNPFGSEQINDTNIISNASSRAQRPSRGHTRSHSDVHGGRQTDEPSSGARIMWPQSCASPMFKTVDEMRAETQDDTLYLQNEPRHNRRHVQYKEANLKEDRQANPNRRRKTMPELPLATACTEQPHRISQNHRRLIQHSRTSPRNGAVYGNRNVLGAHPSLTRTASLSSNCLPRHDSSGSHYISQQQVLIAASPVSIQMDQVKVNAIPFGQGSFGTVHKALDMVTGAQYAVKRIKTDVNEDLKKQYKKEVEVMQQLRHDNIVQYIATRDFDEDGSMLEIFLEYVPGGSLSSLIKEYGALSPALIQKYTRQMVQGILYLHNKFVIHRDIKGGNVLVTLDGTCKLADFGCSRLLSDMQTADREETLKRIRGSVPWMAPEVVRETRYNLPADIWSLAATVLEMGSGQRPWPTIDEPIAAIFQIATHPSPPIPERVPVEVRRFMSFCFVSDPDARPTASDLLGHPFLATATVTLQSQKFSY